MTGPEHYLLAAALVERSGEADGDVRSQIIARAQVHATLALAAATAEPWAYEVSDRTGDYLTPAWVKALS